MFWFTTFCRHYSSRWHQCSVGFCSSKPTHLQNMATRRSSRKSKLPPRLEDNSVTQNKRTANREDQTLSKEQLDEIVKRVTDAVVTSLSHDKNKVNHENENNQSCAEATVQGSVASVLDNITGESRETPIEVENTWSNDKPCSTFVSSSIPLGNRESTKLRAKIFEFGIC